MSKGEVEEGESDTEAGDGTTASTQTHLIKNVCMQINTDSYIFV